ncbi:MAG: DUF3261 domain-containing protein, partial [Spirochaetales bacterium]|nr:DUF3261 domain-containing protein [Spirochaetales bacterium]
IHGSHGDNQYTIQAVVQMDKERLSINAFTAFGVSLFDLVYSKEGVMFKAFESFPEKSGIYLLGDFQLCYYSVEYIEPLIKKAGLNFIETENSEGWERIIEDNDGTIIVKIKRVENKLEFYNYLREYSYLIEEIEL